MNIYATQDYVDDKILAGLQPPPKVTSYTKPTSIPVQSGTQLVFYGSSQGTMSFQLGKKTYTKQLADMNDVGWVLWVQTSDVDGSLIEHGARNYFDMGQRISEIGVTWTPASGITNPNWIVITIS